MRLNSTANSDVNGTGYDNYPEGVPHQGNSQMTSSGRPKIFNMLHNKFVSVSGYQANPGDLSNESLGSAALLATSSPLPTASRASTRYLQSYQQLHTFQQHHANLAPGYRQIIPPNSAPSTAENPPTLTQPLQTGVASIILQALPQEHNFGNLNQHATPQPQASPDTVEAPIAGKLIPLPST